MTTARPGSRTKATLLLPRGKYGHGIWLVEEFIGDSGSVISYELRMPDDETVIGEFLYELDARGHMAQNDAQQDLMQNRPRGPRP